MRQLAAFELNAAFLPSLPRDFIVFGEGGGGECGGADSRILPPPPPFPLSIDAKIPVCGPAVAPAWRLVALALEKTGRRLVVKTPQKLPERNDTPGAASPGWQPRSPSLRLFASFFFNMA